MKIFYVIGSLELGGAEQHLFRVATALKERGYEPEIFAIHPSGPLIERLKEYRIPVYGLISYPAILRVFRHKRLIAWAHLISAAFLLWTLYWRRRPQVTHFFLPAAYIVGGCVSLFGPRMLRIMSRRSLNLYQKNHALFGRLERYLHRHMDFICGNSRAVLKDLVSENVAEPQLKLIYNGIAVNTVASPDLRMAVRTSLGLEIHSLVFIMVANLISYKGHNDLINALAQISDRLPSSWRLLCVGRDDGIGPLLLERSRVLGLASSIRFLGSRKDVPELLAAADIGVLSSHQEGFSNAIIESMAAGLPMVVTDVGGNAEAVVHGQTGYVVPARSPDKLSDALLRLALNPSEREQMGLRARERAGKFFSMATCIERYEKLYRGELDAA